MNETKIIWTEHSWNPATGCDKISAGCKYCYAEIIANRQAGGRAFPNGFGLTLREHKLREPYKHKEPSLIFVNSMSDLFWEKIDDAYRDRVLDVIEDNPQHQFQVLTKRPDVMLRYSRRRKLPDNFWAGATIENQATCDERLETLRKVHASLLFISAEPLLSEIDFDNKLTLIDWVITGGESGNHLLQHSVALKRSIAVRDHRNKWAPRLDRYHWITNIRDACVAQGVAFFHKQWGGTRADSAGREVEGRTWDEFPRYPSKGGTWSNKKLDESRIEPQPEPGTNDGRQLGLPLYSPDELERRKRKERL